jgi:predicted nucleotidyltransferase component of viral defense system
MKALALTQRTKARDMYDFCFLQPNSKLNLNYIRCELLRKGMKVNIAEDVKKLILSKEKNTDMKEKIHEISLFITNKENVSRVEYFFDFLRDLNFDL